MSVPLDNCRVANVWRKQWNVIFFVIPAVSSHFFNGREIHEGAGKSSKTNWLGLRGSPHNSNAWAVGNIFSGQVVGETAKNLSERFGKILQQRQSISINRQDTSTSINTQMDSLIPASKIANLSQGTFVGSVADNFGEEIDQKIFHARIIVDNEKVAAETKAYKKIPVINEFKDADGNDIMQQQIDRNYSQIKADVVRIIEDEMTRIKNDPDLKHLIPQEENDKDNE